MEKETLLLLLQKFNAGTLTQEERTDLTTFFNKKNSRETIVSSLSELVSSHPSSPSFNEERFLPLVSGILKADTVISLENADEEAESFSGSGSGKKKTWWTLAVLILVTLGALSYFAFTRWVRAADVQTNAGLAVNDIPPGGDHAVLTISDGSTIALDSIPTGFVIQEGNAKITKTSGGDLKYNISSEMGGAILFNTVTTPRGGQFQVVLADGSRVKLNSSSSITYPVAFVGSERNVTITGEAYFEVAANAKIPFKVRIYDMEVEVQGTQFNINSYLDEPGITTTLLKGSLKLTKNSHSYTLQSDQQGIFDTQGKFSLNKNVDGNELSAWRNGKFNFNSTELATVMRQISRWYNVEVVYEAGLPQDQPVFGEIRRNAPLSDVIKLLEKSEVRCRIDGGKLIVQP